MSATVTAAPATLRAATRAAPSAPATARGRHTAERRSLPHVGCRGRLLSVALLLSADQVVPGPAGFPRAVANWGGWGFTTEEMVEMTTARAADVLGLGAVTGRLRAGLVPAPPGGAP